MNEESIMNKSFLLSMIAMLVLSVGMTGCSSDDDIDFESLDDNHKNIIGEWQLQSYCWWAPFMDVEPDELTLEFDKDGMVTVNAKDDKFSYFFSVGTYNYSFENVTPIKGEESITILEIGKSPNHAKFSFFYYDYNGDTLLRLWEYGVFDGLECNFKKVK